MSSSPLYESLLNSSGDALGTAKIRASAAVVPWRRDSRGNLQVYWVRRARTVPFMGGWYAFPGGGLSKRDLGPTIQGRPAGLRGDHQTCPVADRNDPALAELSPDDEPGLVLCAMRELFEETGLWPGFDLATESDGPSREDLDAARGRLLDKSVEFPALADELGLTIDGSDLVFAGRWLTPPFAPMRFDNRFFLLEWPASRVLQPSLMGRELDRGEWIDPAAAYERWLTGEVLAAPPILHILRVLAEYGPEGGSRRLLDPEDANLGPLRRIEFRPGVIMLPLRTPTLPPATHTNAFLLGRGDAVLVDPATPFEDEQERLLQALKAAQDQGYRVREIWLTHHHSDHVGAVDRVREALDVPVLAHADTAAALESRGLKVDGELYDGQRVVLDGAPPVTVRVHHTPGHARGHLCFYDETFRTLIGGDLISTLSTIVIDPPDGDMDEYLASLARMAELDARILFPSHGPGTLEHRAKLEQYRQHRLEREEQILTAYRAGKKTPASMVAEVYAEVPAYVHPVAERQIQAHLDRLAKHGKI